MKRTILISTLANGLTSQPNQNTLEEKVAVMFGEVNSDLSQCYDILPGMTGSRHPIQLLSILNAPDFFSSLIPSVTFKMVKHNVMEIEG